MSSTVKVALAGATGNLGPAILKELLDAGFHVTILTRHGSKSTDSLHAHPNQTIKAVDYTSIESLTSALSSISVVVSTLATASISDQKPLVDAAVAAGVSRFIPSEFGSDTSNPKARKLPVYGGKVAMENYLHEQAAKHPAFSYTLIMNNAFFDWGLKAGFLLDPKNHTATLYDGGDRPFSVTRLSTVGKAVVGVINNLAATKNRGVYVHDAAVTQNQIIDVVKKVDGQLWKTQVKATEELERDSYEKLQKGETQNMMGIMMGFLFRAVFGEGWGGDFTGRLDNELLGLPVLNTDEVEAVIKQNVSL